MNRTRSFLSVLGSLLAASPALASSPIWQNNGIFAYTMPPDAAPQIDAAAFVNYGQILLTNFFAEFSPSSVAAYPPPFETWNTVNYTNYNLIQGFPGWRFDYYKSDAATHLSAANFVNQAQVSANNASIYGSFGLEVDATNIFNRGALTVGDSGLLKLSGDNLDLVRSTVASVGADTDPTAYLQATSWSTNTTTFRFDAVLSNLPLPGGFSAYVYITSNPFSGAADVNVIYLSQTNPAISTEVRVFGEYPYGSDRAIQWKSVVTNALTGEVSTDTVYLYDYLGAFISFAGGPPPPLVQIIPNDLRWQFTPTNFVPLNYIVIRSFPGFTNGLLISPTIYDPTIFFGTNNPVLATNTAFGFDLSPTPFVPGSDVAGSDYTNEPGRIELRANNVLDLTDTRISGQSFLLLQATNHFAGSTNAHILAPFASVDLATTNGSMTFSSLVAPIIPRICGHIDVWSGHWTNGVAPDTNAVPPTPGALLNFNVTLIDSRLVTQVQPQFEDVTLHSSNLVVADVLNVFRSLSLPDTQRLSIVTNPPGAPNLYGEINLTSADLVWASSFPRLQYLTNYGKITVPNSLELAGHRAPPWYTTTFDEPYQSFVNYGLITSQGQLIWARFVQSGGTNDSGVGPLALQADTAILTNGMLLSRQADISITSGYLMASNQVLRAGRGISLDCPNLSDGVSNLVNVDPATLRSATLSNANVWVAHGGFSLLAPPVSGDLLGTTITNFGAQDMPVVNFSAAQDRAPAAPAS